MNCVQGQGVHVSPGARLTGSVQVGEQSWIGIGASVKQLVRIDARVIVGAAAAAVVADVLADVIVMSVPARIVQR